ncbi:MAG: heparinase II/III family protein [Paludibacteraceae bacterium]
MTTICFNRFVILLLLGSFSVTLSAQKDIIFYEGLSADHLRFVQKNYPAEVEFCLKSSAEISENVFLFKRPWEMEKTQLPYQFKDTINWCTIPYGDKEWCWVLNRHGYWVDLGRAYLLTGNEEYVRLWLKQINHWIDVNPVGDKKIRSYSWRTIEAGFRCDNWIKSYEYFRHSKLVNEEFVPKLKRSLAEHAAYLSANYSDFSRTSNWGIIEASGFFLAATFLGDHPKAEGWKKQAVERLDTCVHYQVLSDGTHWEQSASYHNEVMYCLLNVVDVAQRQNLEIPENILKKTRAMAMADLLWQKPNRHQPLTGDSDDENLSVFMQRAAVLFRDPLLKHGGDEPLNFDNIFVMNAKQKRIFATMQSKMPAKTNINFPDLGLSVFRNNWTADANYANFSYKKLGDGHAHDDLLNFTLYAHGRDYLVDGGRYTYVDNDARENLKNSFGHNGIVVDSLPNSEYQNSWTNSYNAGFGNSYYYDDEQVAFVEGVNEAYLRLDDPVSVKRSVFYWIPGIWILWDNFQAKQTHTYRQFFNFADTCARINGNTIRTTHEDKNLHMYLLNPAHIQWAESVWSPEYNLLKKSRQLMISEKYEGEGSQITVLSTEGAVVAEKIPVKTRSGKILENKYAEAIKLSYADKTLTLMLVHRPYPGLTPFYKIDEKLVRGNVYYQIQSDENRITKTIK